MVIRPTPFLKTYLGDGVQSGHRAVDQGRAADQVEPPVELSDRRRGRLAEVPLVSVVIPTLNEAANLPHVMSKLPQGIHELILVDGNSTDGTVEVARELYPTVRIVGQSGRGKGNALASGFEACSGDIIVMIDADGSMDPGEIERYVEALVAGADFVKGSRFMEGGGSTDITWTRHLGNLFFTRFTNLLYGCHYTDLCYGYNAFWAHCLPVMNVDCNGFEVETLINIRIAKAGLTVAEVPSFERNRIHGVSNLRTFRDGFRVLRTILRERLPRRRYVSSDTLEPVPDLRTFSSPEGGNPIT